MEFAQNLAHMPCRDNQMEVAIFVRFFDTPQLQITV